MNSYKPNVEWYSVGRYSVDFAYAIKIYTTITILSDAGQGGSSSKLNSPNTEYRPTEYRLISSSNA